MARFSILALCLNVRFLHRKSIELCETHSQITCVQNISFIFIEYIHLDDAFSATFIRYHRIEIYAPALPLPLPLLPPTHSNNKNSTEQLIAGHFILMVTFAMNYPIPYFTKLSIIPCYTIEIHLTP